MGKPPTRLGVVTTSFPRFTEDPAGSFVAEHVAFLRRQGHDVEVLAAGSSSDCEQQGVVRVRASGRLFYSGGGPEALSRWGPAWLDAAVFGVRLARQVRARVGSWQAMVAHWLVPSALCAARFASTQRPLLAVAHSGDVHLLVRLRLAGAAARLLDRPGVSLAFVSHELREIFLDALPVRRARSLAARSFVCAMGIDTERFGRARAARADTERSRVVFVGRLVPVKGVQVLLDAARELPDTEVVVAGAGPLADPLRKDAPGNVSFVGQVLGHERDALLASADVVAVPSVLVEAGRSEGMPRAALEAMASGAALCASRVGGLAELPADTVTWAEPGNARALARALSGLLDDQARRQRQIAQADQFVAQHDWSVLGPRLDPVR